MDARFDEVREKVQSDREFVDTRLSRIDDSAVMKKWVDNRLMTLSHEMINQIDITVNQIKSLIDQTIYDNLLVPDLIGSGQKYNNLKEYLIDQSHVIK